MGTTHVMTSIGVVNLANKKEVIYAMIALNQELQQNLVEFSSLDDYSSTDFVTTHYHTNLSRIASQVAQLSQALHVKLEAQL